MTIYLASILLILISIVSAQAGEVDVVKVEVTKSGDNTYLFQVTLSHQDEGWDHFANKWDVIDAEGAVLGTRVLYHPHTNEQPFTRSLPNVRIPSATGTVTVLGHDSVHEYGGKTVTLDLPQ